MQAFYYEKNNNNNDTFRKYKMKYVLGSAIALLPLYVSANIVITEYVEGSSFNKAIEITNLGSEEISLKDGNYKLTLFTNGKTEANSTTDLVGRLPVNASLVIYNKGLSVAENFASPLGLEASSTINFNGDDTIVLYKGDQVIDSFGQYGVDPGSYFGSSEDNTKDHTLRRLDTVVAGDSEISDNFDPSVQWAFFDKDLFDGLGCSGTEACTGDEPKPILEDGEPPVQNTCIFTTCEPITPVHSSNDYSESTYYVNANAALDSERSEFINAIHLDIKKDHQYLTYNQVWTAMIETDQDPNNTDNVILLYTGKSIAKTENASVNGNSPDAWNREHVWSKSHGFPDRDQLGYTDIHHLRPADASINSLRSNYDFDNGGEVAMDGSIPTGNNLLAGTSWEPRAEVKGDVARMMFYMDIRYQTNSDNNMPDLQLVDRVGTSGAEFGKLCTLYDWHKEDVVDAAELERNNKVYELQGNRNPFIDHPEWVEIVYSSVCEEQEVVLPTVSVAAVTVNEGEQVKLDAVTNVEGLTFEWKQVSGASVTLSANNTSSVTFTAPEVTANTILSFTVEVADVNNNKATANVDVAVNNVVQTEPEPSNSSGGAMYWLLLLMTAVRALRR